MSRHDRQEDSQLDSQPDGQLDGELDSQLDSQPEMPAPKRRARKSAKRDAEPQVDVAPVAANQDIVLDLQKSDALRTSQRKFIDDLICKDLSKRLGRSFEDFAAHPFFGDLPCPPHPPCWPRPPAWRC